MSNIPSFSKSKFASGRFLLTLAAAFCFIWITLTFGDILKQKADSMEVSEILPYVSSLLIILSNIFTFYFTKKAANGNNG